MTKTPAPFTTTDHDIMGMPGFLLDTDRLLTSELHAVSTGDEFKAAVTLWCHAWKQVPAGSLPNNEKMLAGFSGAGSKWKKVRGVALRGFILCDDGRLYHRVLCDDAIRAHAARVLAKSRTVNASNARRGRNGKRDDHRDDDATSSVNPPLRDPSISISSSKRETAPSPSPSPGGEPATTGGGVPAAPVIEKPLSKRAKGFSEIALKLATNSGDVPAILTCFGVTPGHEAEFGRETDGMQVGEIVAVLAWRRYLKDPVRFPSGFRIGRTLWRDLGIDTRRELADSLLGSMGIEVSLKPAGES